MLRQNLVDQVVKWHEIDWRGEAKKSLWAILSVAEKQEVLYLTEGIWMHEDFITGKIKGWD